MQNAETWLLLGVWSRYDDLKNYSNERSIYLAQLRDSIEGPWQAWELSQIDVEALKALSTDEVPTFICQKLGITNEFGKQMEICPCFWLSVAWWYARVHAMHLSFEPWFLCHTGL